MREWHNRFDGIKWRICADGVQIEGQPAVERTSGEPQTVRKIWRDHGAAIQYAARQFGVPIEVLLATIATESIVRDGLRDPKQVREEPGFRSDHETPHKISVGLCHILIETARHVLHYPAVSRGWLSVPHNNIWTAAAIIRDDADVHGFDPPCIAAAYNAGSVAPTQKNRWHLRSWADNDPTTPDHVDRFVMWLGDAIAAMREAGRPSTRDFGWMLASYEQGLLL